MNFVFGSAFGIYGATGLSTLSSVVSFLFNELGRYIKVLHVLVGVLGGVLYDHRGLT